MIKLGQTQTLEVSKTTEFGLYLKDAADSKSSETILLPKSQVPEGTKVGDSLEVFVYKDSEDRPIATMMKPALTLHGLAVLTVKDVTAIGAFLDWGIVKDLLLPFKEQTKELTTGESVLVSLYIDKSKRLCATMKIYDKLSTDSPYKKDDMVEGIIYEIIPAFGAFVAVDDKYSAMIPKQELFEEPVAGTRITARVSSVLADGKLNLSLRKKTYQQLDPDAEMIFEKLKNAGGFLPYHDKSAPDDLKAEFNLSKNAFKRAIGHLFKEKKIEITKDGIKEVK